MRIFFYPITFFLLFILSIQSKIFASDRDALSRLPIIGLIQDNQVPIKVKGTSIGNVRIEYFEGNDSVSNFTEWEYLSYSDDLTKSLMLSDINYNSDYTYRVIFADDSSSEWFSFSTFPQQSQSGEFSFVFSACFREIFLPHNIFNYISMLSPTFVALLGDQIYADYDSNINTGPPNSVVPALRSKYAQNFDEHFQAMSSSVPIIATWDDHDYGQDNSDSTYIYKVETKKVYKESYPIYPYQVEDEGIYYQFKIADVDVFVLDTRWYRSPMDVDDNEDKTMLGEEQLSWLLNGLNQSTAPFKLILSSVSMNDYGGDTSSGQEGYDSWMGYTFERNTILSFIEDNQIYGVLVFSGDQHYPSGHILNWDIPLNYVSQTDSSIVYSLSDLSYAVFDFSSSPFHYNRATGHMLISGNQNNPFYSFEIFRAELGHPSVYGLVQVDTENSTKSVTVTFYELDSENELLNRLYGITVIRDSSTVAISQSMATPIYFSVGQNFPNPFNGATNIIYSIHDGSDVQLSIYDILGSEVITLMKGFHEAGEYKVIWNGNNSHGKPMPSGIYFYRINALANKSADQSSHLTKKMIYLK
jgi:hypothetical protein